MKILAALGCLTAASAYDYTIVGGGSLTLTDVKTTISDLKTIFVDNEIAVAVSGLEWEAAPNSTSGSTIAWRTLVDGTEQASGTVEIDTTTRELVDGFDAGTIQVTEKGRSTVSVEVSVVGDEPAEGAGEFEVYGAGVAIVPLLIILILAMATRMVEFSLFTGIFVGACIIAGNLKDGFKATLDTYIISAVADEGHVFVVMFTLFLSGLVGMLQRSGGMFGFTRDVSVIATGPRLGQFACFLVGVFVFFDDYANVLLAGESMRPLLDLLMVSREKLSFVVDATSAPVASISPVSSWVGFEVGLIQDEIDRLIERDGEENLSIKTSGMGIFLQSIKYRYYPIFMLVLMVMLIFAGRDFGPMLIAERKVRVYERKDGGDGKGKASEMEGSGENDPRKNAPLKAWNMIVPVLILIFFIFYLLVKSGTVEGEDQSFMDKIESSDSYVALLWGTMAAVLVTIILYVFQPSQGENIVIPDAEGIKTWLFAKKDDDDTTQTRSVLDFYECVEAFLFGMARIFPALIVLNLAWASGSLMTAVGADRLFASWIVDGVEAKMLPTLSFVISFFMALATGTSWGTMTILFPLIFLPTYDVSGGDERIVYATVAGVLSGSVAGDHVSPISDTTVLSSLACDCRLLAHVQSQAPYSLFVVLISILLGTLPIGRGGWPNIVGILLGWGIMGAFTWFICKPIVNDNGSYDILTELYLMARGSEELALLKEDTIKRAAGQEVEKKLADSSESSGDEKVVEEEEENLVVVA